MTCAIGRLEGVGSCARMIFMRRAPHMTRYAVALIGRSTRFSTARAREQLGWRPQVGVHEGLRGTLDWYKKLVDRGS